MEEILTVYEDQLKNLKNIKFSNNSGIFMFMFMFMFIEFIFYL